MGDENSHSIRKTQKITTSDEDSHSIPKCWCKFLQNILLSVMYILVSAVVFFAALYLRFNPFSHPTAYIQDVYVPSLVVPALNKTTTFNTSVFIDLKFERDVAFTNYDIEDFRLTMLYGEFWSTSIQVGTHMVQGFSMSRKRRVHVKAVVEAVGMPWGEAFRAVSGGNVVTMTVMVMMGTDPDNIITLVAVDASGHMVSKNDDI